MAEMVPGSDLPPRRSSLMEALWERVRPKKVAFRRSRRVRLLERMAKECLDEVFHSAGASGRTSAGLDRFELARHLRREKRPYLAKLLECPEFDVLRVVLCPSRTRRVVGGAPRREGGVVRVRYRESDSSRTFGGADAKAARLILTKIGSSSEPVIVEDLSGEGVLEAKRLAKGVYRIELQEEGAAQPLFEEVQVVPPARLVIDLTEPGSRQEVAIGGTVRLEGGTPVPGVGVVVEDADKEELHDLVTDADGRYAIRGLAGGRYRIRIDSTVLSHTADLPQPIPAIPGSAVELDFALWPNWNQPVGFLTSLGIWTIQRAPDTPRRPLDHGRVLELVKALRRNGKGDLGRRLVQRKLLPLRDTDRETFDGLFREIRAELALCTAVANDLPPGPRLDEAWKLLNVDRSSDLRTANPEQSAEAFAEQAEQTGDFKRLQRAAYIFTRKWDHERRKDDQEHAVSLYRRAYRSARKARQARPARGAWAINDAEINCGGEAAFQMDLLADVEADSQKRKELQAEATEIRRQLLADFEDRQSPRFAGMKYKRLTSFAQLHLGLFARASDETERAAHLKETRSLLRKVVRMHDESAQQVPLWLRDRKMRQFAERSRLFGLQAAELRELLGGRTEVLRAVAAGKLGLALSGGGFRASFFHLGVLAYLAELNLLRTVEVLSCVSGGSIVGTHYYLKLRRLLQDPVRAVVARLRGFQRHSRPGDEPLAAERTLFLRALIGIVSQSESHASVADRFAELREQITRAQGRDWAEELIDVLRGELAERSMLALDDDLRILLEDPAWSAAGIEPVGEEIGHEDYLVLVKELIEEFMQGVRKNIRTRVVAHPIANLKMLLWPRYNRSNRVGELLEKHLYDQVPDDSRRKKEGQRRGTERALSDMVIRPELVDGFNPVFSNWSRENKVPNLILNATSLNTGHNWQFTAKWMGESPAVIDPAVDANARLRRVYIDEEAPPPHDSISLGWAVATSACVPGLFDPADLKGLYERSGKRIVVRLIDGGVFDNQGVASLLEQDCRILIVSDASGQMDFQDDPSGSPLGVPLRSNTILMDRVRQAQYRDLVAQQRNGQVRSLVFLHLKKGLDSDPVDWILCDDPRAEGYALGFDGRENTAYGVRKDLQRRLADIRTDLDSFCDAEAYALMYSGYQMLCKELEPSLRRAQRAESESDDRAALERLLIDVSGKPIPTWPFMAVSRAMSGKDEDERLESVLETANKRLFRLWRLWFKKRAWRWAATTALIAAAVLGGRTVWSGAKRWLMPDQATLRTIETVTNPVIESGPVEALRRFAGAEWLWIIVVLVLLMAVLPRAFGWLLQKVQLVLLSTAGMVFSWLHLLTIDRAYLRYGRVGDDDLDDLGSRLGLWLVRRSKK